MIELLIIFSNLVAAVFESAISKSISGYRWQRRGPNIISFDHECWSVSVFCIFVLKRTNWNQHFIWGNICQADVEEILPRYYWKAGWKESSCKRDKPIGSGGVRSFQTVPSFPSLRSLQRFVKLGNRKSITLQNSSLLTYTDENVRSSMLPNEGTDVTKYILLRCHKVLIVLEM